MTQRAGATTYRPRILAHLCVVVLAALPGAVPVSHADSAGEAARLAALLRQLNAIERTAQSSALAAPTSHGRYRFDYSRLAADIARIRTGVEDYLRPRRAQPRDVNALIGEYRLETGPQ